MFISELSQDIHKLRDLWRQIPPCGAFNGPQRPLYPTSTGQQPTFVSNPQAGTESCLDTSPPCVHQDWPQHVRPEAPHPEVLHEGPDFRVPGSHEVREGGDLPLPRVREVAREVMQPLPAIVPQDHDVRPLACRIHRIQQAAQRICTHTRRLSLLGLHRLRGMLRAASCMETAELHFMASNVRSSHILQSAPSLFYATASDQLPSPATQGVAGRSKHVAPMTEHCPDPQMCQCRCTTTMPGEHGGLMGKAGTPAMNLATGLFARAA